MRRRSRKSDASLNVKVESYERWKALVQQFFVHERKRRRNRLVVMWSLVGLADVFVVAAYLGGMPVERIAMVLILPVLASFVLLWRGLSDGRRLEWPPR